MTDPRRAGRTVGALMLLQMFGGPTLHFGLMGAVVAAPGFLVGASQRPIEVGLAAVLGLALGAIGIGIAIVAYPVFRAHSRAMAMALFAAAIVVAGLHAAESIANLSMLSLSQAYAKAGSPDPAAFEPVRAVVGMTRNWTHLIAMIAAGTSLLVLHATLLRFALVPRVIACAGVLGAVLHIVAVSMPLFGGRVAFPLMALLGAAQLALMAWLLWRGFADRPPAGDTTGNLPVRGTPAAP